MSDTLVPEPQASIFDSVTKALGNDEDAARRVMLNPNLAKGFKDGKPVNKESKKDGQDTCGCGNHADTCGCSQPQDDDIPLKAVDDIGRATAADVKEALHQVIDPELGIDVMHSPERSVAREIMELLSGLNREKGITILMVTHEPDMAEYAGRVIRFVDGLVESDVRRGEGR